MIERERKPLLEGKFNLIKLDSIVWKQITDRNDIERDLIEFWIEDQGKEVHCVAWDKVANSLKSKLENNAVSQISISYIKKTNRITGKTDYSVFHFEI